MEWLCADTILYWLFLCSPCSHGTGIWQDLKIARLSPQWLAAAFCAGPQALMFSFHICPSKFQPLRSKGTLRRRQFKYARSSICKCLDRKRPVGRPKQRWMENIEKNLKELVCHCMALPHGETELDSRSWLETEKGGKTSLQHPWPDGP